MYTSEGIQRNASRARRLLLALLDAGLVLMLSGCAAVNAAANPTPQASTPLLPAQAAVVSSTDAPAGTTAVLAQPASTATLAIETAPVLSTAQVEGTSTPTPVGTPSPAQVAIERLTGSCNLLNSNDLATIFSTAETIRGQPQIDQVGRPVFSSAEAPARELSCIYYTYHRPGSASEEMIQVTYWVDLPDQPASPAWSQLWAMARSRAAQRVPGVGDDAFYDRGRLTFKEGSAYVTLEVLGTALSSGGTPGALDQLDVERRLALNAVDRLRSAQ
jgi:hypothetical protein